ncbi:CHAT domain-containing protein [Actinospica durhamensis]|uniref:CHAT domain-containing protein n=1 Tax=Actinospica durhamensis TaxID=1508375 RepID=A0A941F0I8_9ACTN|nr:CHAT domain-containing protein [Actinospica durhamensis]MBR7838099.1 CHAT domain-containing protein [Actinospica durhamensis]
MLDFGADGRVGVSVQVDGAPFGERTEPMEWSNPLDGKALEDVRWYLEDYLRAPFAVYEERGQRIHESLKPLGQALFASVFGQGAAREAYLEARARGELGEVVVRAADPAVLGLPWELMCDPALTSPMALSGVALTRMLPSQAPGSRFRTTDERLRVLMVIARPEGEQDVGYQMVARRILPLLSGLRGSVELTVLRPPTLRRFEQVVEAAAAQGTPFQVVHFDGHGAFTAAPSASGGGTPDPLRFAATRRGVLSFEDAQGGAEYVAAETVGQVLAAGKVPLVVLNACQSGQVGGELEAGIATRLLTGGAVSVVAMAYSVYAVAAAEFMAIFYEHLFAGDTVTRAVAAARRHLAVENRRPSAKGRLELADWVIPVHYARTDLSFPSLRSQPVSPGNAPLATIMQRVRGGAATALPAGGAAHVERDLAAFGGLFVGRDGPLYRLDTAARLQHVVVVHGPGGTGKTELAKAFARWWRDTGGVGSPGWIVWYSFEPGVASFGLDGAVTAAGLHLAGPDFALLDEEQRREALLQILEEHRVLLIWDNFESAVTMPDSTGATPTLDPAEQAQITAFLTRVRERGTGAIVITSRTPETWLGPATRRITVGGLSRADAAEYTDLLLAPYPAARTRRKDKAFGELLTWLDGHPLSMRLTLPQLEHTNPSTLLGTLRGLTPPSNPTTGLELADRHSSLAGSIAASIRHLTPEQQDALTVLALLHGVADEDVLAWFSEHSATPEQFSGFNVENWRGTLERAAGLGLLDPIGAGMYEIHPALPAYLAAHWQNRYPGTYEQQREQSAEALLAAHAVLGGWLSQQLQGTGVGTAMAILEWQRRNLGAQLGHALDHAQWTEAAEIAEPLV